MQSLQADRPADDEISVHELDPLTRRLSACSARSSTSSVASGPAWRMTGAYGLQPVT